MDVTKLGLPWVDYKRLNHYWQRHHVRFERFVEGRKLTCMDCRGKGGETQPVLEDGSGPWESCGWCEGTGYMTPQARGLWLGYKKEDKKERALRIQPLPAVEQPPQPAATKEKT